MGKLIVILGYTLTQNCGIPPILESRLERGLLIYEPQDTVLVCGYTSPKCLDPTRCEKISQAEVMKQYLIKYGIAENKIIKEEKSTTTFGNAFYGAIFIEDLLPKQIVIVTNEFHYPSVKYSFNKVLGNRYSYTFEIIPDSILDVSPSELERWSKVIQEMTSTYYPMLFKDVADGDRETLQKLIEGPISPKFKSYVQNLLNLAGGEDLKELISG